MATKYKPTRATLAEHTNSVWRFKDFPLETSVDHLLDPETWAHVSSRFLLGDEIIVTPQGLPYRAHLIVVEAHKLYAKVRLIGAVPLNAATVEEAAADEAPVEGGPMYVKWNLGSKKYAVHRRSDNEKIHDGFAIKADAEAWAAQHTLAMAA